MQRDVGLEEHNAMHFIPGASGISRTIKEAEVATIGTERLQQLIITTLSHILNRSVRTISIRLGMSLNPGQRKLPTADLCFRL